MSIPSARPRGIPAPRHRQRGIVFIIALIVLVVMTLAGTALFRQVGTGIVIAGNITFKRIATVAADRGVEDGRAWLLAQSATTLQNDGTGYYSNWDDTFDPVTYAWSNANSVQTTPDDGGGNEVRWVMHRLCQLANTPVNAGNQQCVSVSSALSGGSQSAGGYGAMPITNTIQPYFRVTVRVAGPRNTTSHVQVIMY